MPSRQSQPGAFAGLEIAVEDSGRSFGVGAEDEVDLVRVGSGLEIGEHVDGQARFLCQIPQEEIGLGELRRGQRLALELCAYALAFQLNSGLYQPLYVFG